MILKLFRTLELVTRELKLCLMVLLKVMLKVEKVETKGMISLLSLTLLFLNVLRQVWRKDLE